MCRDALCDVARAPERGRGGRSGPEAGPIEHTRHAMNSLLRRWYFPLLLQVFTLGTFLLLIIGGLAANTDDMAFAKVLRNTNLANLVVWSYWWPLLISLALIGGGIALSAVIVRKLAGTHVPGPGWHARALYLIPGLYGGAFAVMLCAWRLCG